jgi:hypothetical protein
MKWTVDVVGCKWIRGQIVDVLTNQTESNLRAARRIEVILNLINSWRICETLFFMLIPLAQKRKADSTFCNDHRCVLHPSS